jgi:hypothetical protein
VDGDDYFNEMKNANLKHYMELKDDDQSKRIQKEVRK